jgi:hypothetical protein
VKGATTLRHTRQTCEDHTRVILQQQLAGHSHDSTLSPYFIVHTGVRQGCLLSPLIFLVVIDWIKRTSLTPPRGIQWSLTAKLEDLDFADDVSLLSHKFQQIQLKTSALYTTAKSTKPGYQHL